MFFLSSYLPCLLFPSFLFPFPFPFLVLFLVYFYLSFSFLLCLLFPSFLFPISFFLSYFLIGQLFPFFIFPVSFFRYSFHLCLFFPSFTFSCFHSLVFHPSLHPSPPPFLIIPSFPFSFCFSFPGLISCLYNPFFLGFCSVFRFCFWFFFFLSILLYFFLFLSFLLALCLVLVRPWMSSWCERWRYKRGPGKRSLRLLATSWMFFYALIIWKVGSWSGPGWGVGMTSRSASIYRLLRRSGWKFAQVLAVQVYLRKNKGRDQHYFWDNTLLLESLQDDTAWFHSQGYGAFLFGT